MNALQDSITFELPTSALARALHLQLALAGRAERAHEDDERWLVIVLLDEDTDLAAVLRVVERWVLRSGLGAIRYHLDGRAYVLAAGEVAWSGLFESGEPAVGRDSGR